MAERTGRGWRLYLALAAVLAPLCVPAGPGQSAVLDVVNLVALAVFFVVTMAGQKLRVPLAVPMLIIGAGSLLATMGAPSVKLVALSLSQDFYLFAWFVVLVNVLRTERDLRLVRVACMWTGAIVAGLHSQLPCVTARLRRWVRGRGRRRRSTTPTCSRTTWCSACSSRSAWPELCAAESCCL
jgi:hypothetical protein